MKAGESMCDYFVDASDIIKFRPVIGKQALLELLKANYPESPIEGAILLKIKDGYEIKCTHFPEKDGFIYSFTNEQYVSFGN